MNVSKRKKAYIHASAVVDKGAHIGQDSSVWHFCHLMPGARIGIGCSLGQNVFMAKTAIMGDRCKIQNNVSLYDGVILHDDVFVGPSAVFTNVINPRANIVRKEEYRKTEVEHGATIGANCTIVCGNRIGAHALIAAGAVVTHDVPPFALMAGVPARRIAWVCVCGVTLPKTETSKISCTGCTAAYRLVGRGDQQTLLAVEKT